jgi:hypothetical protein
MDKTELRAFRVALVEKDQALSPDSPFYVPGLHGNDEEDVIAALME